MTNRLKLLILIIVGSTYSYDFNIKKIALDPNVNYTDITKISDIIFGLVNDETEIILFPPTAIFSSTIKILPENVHSHFSPSNSCEKSLDTILATLKCYSNLLLMTFVVTGTEMGDLIILVIDGGIIIKKHSIFEKGSNRTYNTAVSTFSLGSVKFGIVSCAQAILLDYEKIRTEKIEYVFIATSERQEKLLAADFAKTNLMSLKDSSERNGIFVEDLGNNLTSRNSQCFIIPNSILILLCFISIVFYIRN